MKRAYPWQSSETSFIDGGYYRMALQDGNRFFVALIVIMLEVSIAEIYIHPENISIGSQKFSKGRFVINPDEICGGLLRIKEMADAHLVGIGWELINDDKYLVML